MSYKVLFAMLLVADTAIHATPLLASFSGDLIGVPRQFNLIDVETSSASSPFALGDGSIGYTGGLTYLPAVQKFWTIYDDGSGDASLASFDLTGPGSLTASTFVLDPGIWRGLTRTQDAHRFYAWYSNGMDPFELRELDLLNNKTTTMLQGPAGNREGSPQRGLGKLPNNYAPRRL